MDHTNILAKWRLGLLRSDRLPSVATEMLASGFDSPGLVTLAGLDLAPFDPRDAADLWTETIVELDLDIPSAEDALLVLVCPIAMEILRGDLDPIVGASRIVEIGMSDPQAASVVSAFAYPVDVSRYYRHEPGLRRRERRRVIRALAETAMQEALVTGDYFANIAAFELRHIPLEHRDLLVLKDSRELIGLD